MGERPSSSLPSGLAFAMAALRQRRLELHLALRAGKTPHPGHSEEESAVASLRTTVWFR
jgi:hypothetical protein